MKTRKFLLGFASMILMTSLAACAGSSEPSTPVDPTPSTPEVDVVTGVTLSITGSSAKLNAGGTFESLGYKVIVHHSLNGDFDLTGKSSITLEIKDPNGKTGYGASDPLMVSGTYTVTAKYRKETTSNVLTFTVEGGTPDKASHFNKTVENFDGKDFYTLQKNMRSPVLKSSGEQKLLVVPVEFEDKTFTAEELDRIDKVFGFGNDHDNSDVSWETLNSYYWKSSYGKLDLDGTITNAFHVDKTVQEVSEMTADDAGVPETSPYHEYWNFAWTAADAIYEWLPSQGINPKDYDLDGDGFIDGLWMIYSPDYKQGTEPWWAFTHSDYTNTGKENVDSPVPYKFCWASQKFIHQGYYSDDGIDIDAHTLIHETGHMMGLNDYYDTDSKIAPAFGCDMMDLNIGDHNPYSKMAFNWITPRVMDTKSDYFEVELEPFQKNGDCLLIHTDSTELTPTAKNPNNDEPDMIEAWNGSPFDEYLLMAYYTPDGLNEKDSTGYPEWVGNASYGNGGPYRKAGIQLWHIDARLVKHRIEAKWQEWTDEWFESTAVEDPETGLMVSGEYVTMPSSNTPSRATSCMTPDSEDGLADGTFLECVAITSDGKTDHLSKRYDKRMGMAEDCLFLPGDNFGFSKEKFGKYFQKLGADKKSYTFNDGTPIEYNFAVEECGETAKILFAKN